MGNGNECQSFFRKGQGLIILSIKINSPFDGKVQPFFDFIIDVIPLEPQRSPKQILDKLTLQTQNQKKGRTKNFNQIIAQNEDRKIQLKIVSTKDRNVRSIMITPNRNWNGSMDLIGVTVRKQKFDEAFDTYSPVADVMINSPVHMAGIKEGEYLLGCLEFQYNSLNSFIQGIYDRFFDKEVTDKHVHLALYDMLTDQVSIKPVLLKRGWGGNGLLGCQFMQGQIYKFPHNLKQRRQKLLEQQISKNQRERIKNQLGQCDGASKTLVQALKNKRNKRGKHIQAFRNLISIPLPEIPQPIGLMKQCQFIHPENREINVTSHIQTHHQNIKISQLQRRVSQLQQTLDSFRQYLEASSLQEYQLNNEHGESVTNYQNVSTKKNSTEIQTSNLVSPKKVLQQQDF